MPKQDTMNICTYRELEGKTRRLLHVTLKVGDWSALYSSTLLLWNELVPLYSLGQLHSIYVVGREKFPEVLKIPIISL